jgi:flagellar biosynthetic protein FliR
VNANELLTQVGPSQLVGFILVLARLTPLFLFAPVLSSKMVPMRVRGVVAVALAVGLSPLALSGQVVPTDAVAILGLIAKELMVGLVFAFIIGLLFAALSVAGTLVDSIIGFSFGAMVDPITGNQGTILSQTYALMGVMVFVAINGDAMLIAGFAKTFELVPLLDAPNMNRMLDGAIGAFTGIFSAAVQICAPVLLALLLTDIAFGLVTKVVPTLNVFSLGLPTKVLVGIIVFGASLPFVGGFVADEMQTSVETALRSIGVS